MAALKRLARIDVVSALRVPSLIAAGLHDQDGPIDKVKTRGGRGLRRARAPPAGDPSRTSGSGLRRPHENGPPNRPQSPTTPTASLARLNGFLVVHGEYDA